MRLLTPLPRHHTWCPLGSAPMPPAQISGFLDGDGSVGLYAADPEGQSMRIKLALATRDDDLTPLLVAASAGAALARPIGGVYHDPRVRQYSWLVTAGDQLASVLRWLSAAPSLAPRAWRRMTIVREAALLLVDGQQERKHYGRLSAGDRARLRELNQLLLDEAVEAEIPETLRLASDHDFGWYLSGFFAAEGCLSLRQPERGYRHAVVITQRVDNVDLLEEIRRRTGVGHINTYRGPRGSAYAMFAVSSREDCRRFARWLVRYPMPVTAPKARLFRWWMASLNRRFELVPRSRRRRWLNRYEAGIRATRTYAGPRQLCSCSPQEVRA